MQNFRDKTLQQIRWWAWLAAVLPVAALAGLFFLWTFGTTKMFNIGMMVGETIMFTVAVIWWWWALYTIKTLVNDWGHTGDDVLEVLQELQQFKKDFKTYNDTKLDK